MNAVSKLVHLWCSPYAQVCYLKFCLHCIFLVQRLNCGTAGLQYNEYSVCGSRTAELKVTIFFMSKRNFKSQNILCAEAELQVTEYSACGISLVFYAMARMTRECSGRRPLGQKPSWRCWYLLFHLGGDP